MPMKGSLPTIESRPVQRLMVPFARFVELESAGSIALLSASIIAFVLANSRFGAGYESILDLPVAGRVGEASFQWSLHEIVNEALMAFFFLLVGLEVKREFLIGQLSTVRKALLPLLGALGGVVVPALIYWAINRTGPHARGWGIPVATDIAFALAIISVFGRRVPISLRMFLLALAVTDDIVGVLIIAVAYSTKLHLEFLGIALFVFLLCLGLNRLGVASLGVYSAAGILLWSALYLSGVHATLAGIALAFAIPSEGALPTESFLEQGRERLTEIARSAERGRALSRDTRKQLHVLRSGIKLLESPADRMEARLHPWVSFLILPLFALTNTGVPMQQVPLHDLLVQPVFYGVLVGLVLGKPIGITLMCWIAVRLRIAELPMETGWKQLHAAAWLGGIGFTVSIFIAELAFEADRQYSISRVAVFAGSICAASIGSALLTSIRPTRHISKAEERPRHGVLPTNHRDLILLSS